MGRANFHEVSDEERLKIIETLKTSLSKESTVVFAFLHGSFFSESRFRDIDIGVFITSDNPSVYLDIELDLSRKIEESLGSKFPVGVKVINHAPLSFRYSVIKGKLLFSMNDDLLVGFMTTTARQYLDFAPIRYRYMKEAMQT